MGWQGIRGRDELSRSGSIWVWAHNKMISILELFYGDHLNGHFGQQNGKILFNYNIHSPSHPSRLHHCKLVLPVLLWNLLFNAFCSSCSSSLPSFPSMFMFYDFKLKCLVVRLLALAMGEINLKGQIEVAGYYGWLALKVISRLSWWINRKLIIFLWLSQELVYYLNGDLWKCCIISHSLRVFMNFLRLILNDLLFLYYVLLITTSRAISFRYYEKWAWHGVNRSGHLAVRVI